MKTAFTVQGKLVDVHQKRIYGASIHVEGERIVSIEPEEQLDPRAPFILPGFVDSHVHVESSMLIPSEFARLAVLHGTVATVSDPHEIANVCGMEGIEFMISNGNSVPFKFNFGAPSCVPATQFETAGATITAGDIEQLMKRKEILYLSEMMNFPGVLNGDADVLNKIASARRHNKPVDGHAPGLRADQARQYIAAGISTDHECFTKEEALDKLKHGMKILIREGSAAKNFDALVSLLHDHEDMMMFCSDDKHPDSLVEGHIDQLCARAVACGVDVFRVLKAACLNPVNHYKLKVGLLRINDFADFIMVEDLVSFKVLRTYINGGLAAAEGKSLIEKKPVVAINHFKRGKLKAEELVVRPNGSDLIPVILALDGQLITEKTEVLVSELMTRDARELIANPGKDLLKMIVVNRYQTRPPAVSFIKNFGLKRGAIASSVAHDSHNIVAVGADDESLSRAINLVVSAKGGISCVDGDSEMLVALPVAGLMSAEDGFEVARKYSAIDAAAKALGSTLSAPYMTLSFMALLVIPHIKLSDLGLFDGDSFDFIKERSPGA